MCDWLLQAVAVVQVEAAREAVAVSVGKLVLVAHRVSVYGPPLTDGVPV